MSNFVVALMIQMPLRRKCNPLQPTYPASELAVGTSLVEIVELCMIGTLLRVDVQASMQIPDGGHICQLEIPRSAAAHASRRRRRAAWPGGDRPPRGIVPREPLDGLKSRAGSSA